MAEMETKLQLVDSLSAPAPPRPETPDLGMVSLQCGAKPDVPAVMSSNQTTSPQATASSSDDDDDDPELTGTGEGGEYEDGADHTDSEPFGDTLTDRQGKALETVYQRAAYITDILLVSDQFPMRCQSLGLDIEDMRSTMKYLTWGAPIIIHFKVEDCMLSKLLNDTHYRNLFETGASNGNTCKQYRSMWEDRVFGDHYHGAKDYERPKYGILNPSNDPGGFRNIWDTYGDSYMVVKNSPRLRASCTVANRDTSNLLVAVTDFRDWRSMILLLWSFTDDELIDVTEVATGKKSHGDSTLAEQYKEVQIHGPVQLNEDIAELVLHPQYKKKRYIHTLKRIKEKHGINFSWMKLD